MTRVIKAIYEKGVFRPLEKVSLPEKTEAEVIIKEKLIEENIEKISKEVDEILKEVRITFTHRFP